MEKNLTGLPVELLNGVISLLDRTSLRDLRCTCRLFEELTTRKLFENLQLLPGDESCRRFKTLLQGNTVKNSVRNISLRTCEEDWDSDSDLDRTVNDEEELDSHFLDNVKEQISSLDQFPQLIHVALCFESHFFLDDYDYKLRSPPEDIGFREEALKLFFSCLASSSIRLHSLAVQNFQGSSIRDPETPALMTQVLQGLRSLRLGIVNMKIDPDVGYIVAGNDQSIIPELHSVWLNPTMSSLEHLTLHSDQYFGLHPKLDLSSTHFPKLKSLALGTYAFCHDAQVDWIISHALTLRELYLNHCTIIHTAMGWYEGDLETYHPAALSEEWEIIEREDYDGTFSRYMYPRRWHDYFNMFRMGLPLLRHFRIGEFGNLCEKKPHITIGLFKDRYMVFDGPGGYETADEIDVPDGMGDIPSCDEEDKEALCALFQKIGQTLTEEDWFNEDLIEK